MPPEPLILFPPFRLDVRNEQLWRDNEVVPVRPKPFAVLAYLATRPDQLVTATELRKVIWPDTYVGEGLLRGYIREIRNVLGDDAERPDFIETIPRRGYRFLPMTTTAPPVQSSKFKVQSHEEEARDWRLEASFLSSPVSSLQPLASNVVGRDTELVQLHRWWEKAATGARQVVFVHGEPGIGKTTLVDAFLHSLGSNVLSPEEEDQKSKVKAQKPVLSVVEGSKVTDPRPPTPDPWVARGQCIEHYGTGEAYLPVLEALGRLCRQPDGEQVVTLLSRYAPTWLVQMPALVSDSQLETLQRKVQGATRERMLREMAEAIEALTAEQPLILVLEDLHWSDHSTLDLLGLLAQRRGPARLLLLATYRPADVIVSGHPLRALKQELHARGQCQDLPVEFLTTSEVGQYLAARFSQWQFPAELASVLHDGTEGNPLFMVTVVDDWIRQGMLIATGGRGQFADPCNNLIVSVPESLRQLIEKQLERLTPEERHVLETASVVGGEFATATVVAGVDKPTERVEMWCEGLAKRRQFLQVRGTETLADGTVTSRYRFLHALYQQVLYERLTAVRRIQLHRRIGEREEKARGGQANEIAVELAMHFERGQDYTKAVHYCYQAGRHAWQRFAAAEAAQHFRQGLTLLAALPDSRERQHQELSLLLALSSVLWLTDPELGPVYTQASTIAQQLDLPVERFTALFGLQGWYITCGEFQKGKELGEQTRALLQDFDDPVLQFRASSLMIAAHFHCGELQIAHTNAAHAVTQYDALPSHTAFMQYGQNPKVPALCLEAETLWLLGYPDQASRQILEALRWANELLSPFGIATAHFSVALIHQFLGSGTVLQKSAEEAGTAAAEHSSRMSEGVGRAIWGWSLVVQGQKEAGWQQLQQGENLLQALGGKGFRSYVSALVADAHRQSQQIEAGLAAITEALMQSEESGERFWEAELYRLKGELLLAQESKEQRAKSQEHRAGSKEHENQKSKVKVQKPVLSVVEGSKVLKPKAQILDPPSEAEECFLKAIAIARQQHAKSLELRAAASLVRLRQRQVAQHAARSTQHGPRTTRHATHNRLAEAHNMLSEVYNWFTEGFDTADLTEAKVLLQELSKRPSSSGVTQSSNRPGSRRSE